MCVLGGGGGSGGSQYSLHRRYFGSIVEADRGERVSQSAPHEGVLVVAGVKADVVRVAWGILHRAS